MTEELSVTVMAFSILTLNNCRLLSNLSTKADKPKLIIQNNIPRGNKMVYAGSFSILLRDSINGIT